MARNMRRKTRAPVKGSGPFFDAAKMAVKFLGPIVAKEIGEPAFRALSKAVGTKVVKRINKKGGAFEPAGGALLMSNSVPLTSGSGLKKQPKTFAGGDPNFPTVTFHKF